MLFCIQLCLSLTVIHYHQYHMHIKDYHRVINHYKSLNEVFEFSNIYFVFYILRSKMVYYNDNLIIYNQSVDVIGTLAFVSQLHETLVIFWQILSFGSVPDKLLLGLSSTFRVYERRKYTSR